MSNTTIDYLPFDYTRYSQEVVPALQQATEGNSDPLHALLASATHFSPSVRSLYPVPLPDQITQQLLTNSELLTNFEIYGPCQLGGLLDVASLRRIKAGAPFNPWPYLVQVIPSLKGRTLENLGHYGQILHFYLLYSLCCVPPQISWVGNDPVVPHDETISDWGYYTRGDKETQALWEIFEQTPSTAMAQQLHLTHHESKTPRALNFTVLQRERVIGFITPEETQYLLDHVQPHKKPPLWFIVIACLRYGFEQNWTIDLSLIDPLLLDEPAHSWNYTEYEGKWIHDKVLFDHWMTVHPQEMTTFAENHERYTYTYHYIWHIEEEILQRMRLAVSHGYGMIKTYYN